MKVVILAGGYGTRISEESHLRPKPMIEIGGRPILWHIMKHYSHYGYNDFVICAGYMGYAIKDFFSNYFLHMSDITFDFRSDNLAIIHQSKVEPWRVSIVDTGQDTMTGGRIKRVASYLAGERFMLTYGDGVSNINIAELVRHHEQSKAECTLTAIRPVGRFGLIEESENFITHFHEKPSENGWINGGFMVCNPKVIDYIVDDNTSFEFYSLPLLSKEVKLSAYHHSGFWMCMDTLRDKLQLEELWKQNKALWKTWSN